MLRTTAIRARTRPAILTLILFTLACADTSEPPLGPPSQPTFAVTQSDIARAIEVQERFTPALRRMPGVLGTAVGLLPNGRPGIRVFVATPDAARTPDVLEGVGVVREVTGLITVISNPTTRARPAPLGFSVGHPAITAGTIGARVRDSGGSVFILSNNHVLAASNAAAIGDPILQPGPYDGGTATDQIATLSDFEPIDFSGAANVMDAAIASTTAAEVGNETPLDDAYGAPAATIHGDGNGDGFIDNEPALLGLSVMKYGRTTGYTEGSITGINGQFSICYEALFGIFCLKSAWFEDQLLIQPGGFSAGGDSGSLIVAAGTAEPVALLFAGSQTETIANRIDFVLDRFGVAIDAGPTPPPTPTTDIAIHAVTAPSSAILGDAVQIQVTVRNVGNIDVAGDFEVALHDMTESAPLGTQTVGGLAAGATTTLTFPWNTAGASPGEHTLRASHTFADDNSGNDLKTTTVTVLEPGAVGIHVGDLDPLPSADGRTWSAIVEVAVHDQDHNTINGATVVGVWEPAGLASDECTTGELGGNGTCIFLYPNLAKKQKNVRFTVTSVTLNGQTYQFGDNHDPDGDSDGTTVVVIRP